MPSYTTSSSLPLSFRSSGGSKYPPRYSGGPQHLQHATSNNMMSNTANLQIPGFTSMKMDITPSTQMTMTSSVAYANGTGGTALASGRLTMKRVEKLSKIMAAEKQKGQMGKQQVCLFVGCNPFRYISRSNRSLTVPHNPTRFSPI